MNKINILVSEALLPSHIELKHNSKIEEELKRFLLPIITKYNHMIHPFYQPPIIIDSTFRGYSFPSLIIGQYFGIRPINSSQLMLRSYICKNIYLFMMNHPNRNGLLNSLFHSQFSTMFKNEPQLSIENGNLNTFLLNIIIIFNEHAILEKLLSQNDFISIINLDIGLNKTYDIVENNLNELRETLEKFHFIVS